VAAVAETGAQEGGVRVDAPGPAPADAGGDLCADVLVAGAGGLGDRPLTYRVPPALRPVAALGARAIVPLGARRAMGFVVALRPRPEDAAGDARAMRDVIDLPDDAPLFSESLLALAREIAADTLSSLLDAVQCLVPPEVFRRPAPRRPAVAVRDTSVAAPPRLGRRQAAVLAAVSASPGGVPVSDLVRTGGRAARAALAKMIAAGTVRLRNAPRTPAAAGDDRAPAADAPRPGPATLLLGRPDARAAWIADAVARTVREGGRALVVVPEIADAQPWAERLARTPGGALVFHSDLSPHDRREAWDRIHGGRAAVVVGTRSALFAPVRDLRLIVLEEEQSEAHKSEAAPRYHARDVARRRAGLERAALVLASAAPSLEAYAASAAGELSVVRLPAPPGGTPSVGVVDMRAEQRRGHVGYLSRTLVQAMSRHLRARGRIALIVARSGYARVLLCRECGTAVRCPACGVAMAYDRETGTVSCRLCGRTDRAPDVCPRCRGVDLRGVGAGTKRVEEVVARLFPALRMARLDAETARAAERAAGEFADGRVRLLIGTAPLLRRIRVRPSLVGVIDADGPLYLPDFRAAERALQRLRAAVDLAGAEAIVQTRVADHAVMRALRTGSDAEFYEGELAARRAFGYPPCAGFVQVVAEAAAPAGAEALAQRVAAAARAGGLDVLGPAPVRRAGRRAAGTHDINAGRPGRGARAQCVLRGPDRAAVREAVRAVLAGLAPPRGGRLIVDVDPQEML
jgi:primosomal protein N' (replication factor Y)